jgi:hypothetical protein
LIFLTPKDKIKERKKMRKLVLILIASIAVITFIRAFDNSGRMDSVGMNPAALHSGEINTGVTAALVVE